MIPRRGNLRNQEAEVMKESQSSDNETPMQPWKTKGQKSGLRDKDIASDIKRLKWEHIRMGKEGS